MENILGTQAVMLDGSKVTISQHAICRYAERLGGDEKRMRDQLSLAVLYGAQRGSDRIFVDEGDAFVLDRFGVIKTTLTKNMLIANMQVAFRGLTTSEPVSLTKQKAEFNLQFIASLAAKHCSSCFPNCFGKRCRKSRNHKLQKLGFSPHDENFRLYNEMFLAAYKEASCTRRSLNGQAANYPLPEATRLAK